MSGYHYRFLEGSLGAYAMGSPEAFRPEASWWCINRHSHGAIWGLASWQKCLDIKSTRSAGDICLLLS